MGAAAITLLYLSIGAMFRNWLVDHWPRLQKLVPPAIEEGWVYLVYFFGPMLFVLLGMFLTLMLFAPSQLDAEKDLSHAAELKKGGSPEIPRGLSIEHTPVRHLTKHPNGVRQVRVSVLNECNQVATRVRLRLRSIIPLHNARNLAAYTSQFNDETIRMSRSGDENSLNPGDGLEFIVVSLAPSRQAKLTFHCESGDCEMPLGKLQLELVATAENSVPSEVHFFELHATKSDFTFKVTPQSTA